MPVCDNSLKIFLRVICVCYNSVTEQLLFPTTDKATNPSNRQEDWEYIIGFCDQINKELEGPQISVRLLAHKIQSPQEWEALQALTVLEACMKNCGRRFHNEVGKFRFLNELIKVVSPKYLGDRVSEKVKVKVIELLYSWSVALPDEAKIKEAYQMLKRQGIVTIDPDVPVDKTLIPSPPARPKNPVFENEEKSKRLAELLKSKKPEDLQEANRLIKNMVKEDEARMQKVTKRTCTLEEASNSVKLLNEMLSHFNREESTQADRELIKELHDDCDKLRRDVFKLATETEDNDNSLGDILQASDDLSRVINSYKKIVEGQTINGDTPGSSASECTHDGGASEILIDLASSDVQAPSGAVAADLLMPSPLPCSLPTRLKQLSGQGSYSVSSGDNACLNLGQTSTSLSLLDEELLSLGNTHSSQPSHSSEHESEIETLTKLPPFVPRLILSSAVDSETDIADPAPLFGMPATSTISASVTLPSLGMLPAPLCTSSAKVQVASATPGSPLFRSMSPTLSVNLESPARGPEVSLANVFVPLDAIKPSKICPVTAYDKTGVRVLLHFATECPPGRSDVLVIVVSMLNTAPLPVRNVVLQAAVPKSMKVKLQPPSGADLPPFNPILPPGSITQVMLLANPLKEKVRLRYKLTFTLGEQLCTEVGEVDQFPPAEKWGCL
uniref:Golgi associated, gamma adaptin ear containing, ARF binding protein 3a n=1 Tax=Denticeps clupeoides TaxID=299321 RepID=A0AAY4CRI6_9TELE